MAQNANPRDAQNQNARLDAADLSEGDVVRVEFSDDDLGDARYEVEGPWNDDETANLDALDRPSAEAEDMFPGLKARRVWTENAGDYRDLPRLRATLVLDAGSATAGVVDNYPDDETDGYEVLSVSRAEVLSFEDRATVEGDMSAPIESHVARVVREAFETNPLVGTLDAESVTLQDADHSGTGVLGNDLGPVVRITAALDLQVREAFEECLFEDLNDGYSFECERAGVWSFYEQ